ncbi:MAG TPA: ketopantoate reductase family protein [Vicinamibacteria bacterium]|nr:ketopantoate reductase family protein [Vicinamibacteria bacterium]
MSDGPRITILGTGALATYFGARLGRGRSVTVGGSWHAGIEALRAPGAWIEGETPVPVDARPLDALDGPADFVLVLVKAPHTTAIAPVAARVAGPRGMVVTLQNGLGLRALLQAAAGRDRVVAGVTDLGATLLGPGRVRAFPGRVVLEDHAAVASLADAFRASGLPTETVADLRPFVWRKLAVNCALNAITALLDVDNGAVLEDPSRRMLAEKAAREVAAVAAASGVALPGDAAEEALAVARRTAANRSSMRQDLARRAPTEIEFLNGAVVREGLRLGVPAPVNAWLANEVRDRELAAVAR